MKPLTTNTKFTLSGIKLAFSVGFLLVNIAVPQDTVREVSKPLLMFRVETDMPISTGSEHVVSPTCEETIKSVLESTKSNKRYFKINSRP